MTDSVPNRTVAPTGALNCDTRAVILSSPCIWASGSAIISAALAPAAVSTSATSAPIRFTDLPIGEARKNFQFRRQPRPGFLLGISAAFPLPACRERDRVRGNLELGCKPL